MESFDILFINFLIYLCTLVLYLKKKKSYDLGFVCLFTFTLSSFSSVWYYSFDNVPLFYPDIRVEALLYIYILFMLCISPLLSLNNNDIQKINTSGFNKILRFLSITFSILSIPVFINLILNFALKSFSGNALSSMYESNEDNAVLIFAPWSKFFFSAIRRFYDLIVFLFFYNIAKRNKKKHIYGLGISFLSFFLYDFQSGSRGGLVMHLITAVGYILIFNKIFSKQIKKQIKIISICVCSTLVLGLSAISISRFSSNDTRTSDILIEQWIAQYLGESMIRFSDTLYPIDKQLNGDKNFSYLKSLIGFESISNNEKANLHYQARIGAETSVFYTFIGSFYLDFNKLGTILFCMALFFFLSFVCRRIKRRKYIGFIESIIIVKIFKMYASGFTSNVYAVTSIQKDEFIFWLFILLLYFFHHLYNRNRITHNYEKSSYNHPCLQENIS